MTKAESSSKSQARREPRPPRKSPWAHRHGAGRGPRALLSLGLHRGHCQWRRRLGPGTGGQEPCSRAVPLWQHRGGDGSPCGSSCQSSSPSELLKLELELEPGLGLGPAKQAKRKGLPGKIPFREFSRQRSGEGFGAAPGQTATEEHSVHRLDDRQEAPLALGDPVELPLWPRKVRGSEGSAQLS